MEYKSVIPPSNKDCLTCTSFSTRDFNLVLLYHFDVYTGLGYQYKPVWDTGTIKNFIFVESVDIKEQLKESLPPLTLLAPWVSPSLSQFPPLLTL